MPVARAAGPIADEAYLHLALANEERPLEHCHGRVWEKPDMSAEHNDAMIKLGTPTPLAARSPTVPGAHQRGPNPLAEPATPFPA